MTTKRLDEAVAKVLAATYVAVGGDERRIRDALAPYITEPEPADVGEVADELLTYFGYPKGVPGTDYRSPHEQKVRGLLQSLVREHVHARDKMAFELGECKTQCEALRTAAKRDAVLLAQADNGKLLEQIAEGRRDYQAVSDRLDGARAELATLKPRFKIPEGPCLFLGQDDRYDLWYRVKDGVPEVDWFDKFSANERWRAFGTTTKSPYDAAWTLARAKGLPVEAIAEKYSNSAVSAWGTLTNRIKELETEVVRANNQVKEAISLAQDYMKERDDVKADRQAAIDAAVAEATKELTARATTLSTALLNANHQAILSAAERDAWQDRHAITLDDKLRLRDDIERMHQEEERLIAKSNNLASERDSLKVTLGNEQSRIAAAVAEATKELREELGEYRLRESEAKLNKWGSEQSAADRRLAECWKLCIDNGWWPKWTHLGWICKNQDAIVGVGDHYSTPEQCVEAARDYLESQKAKPEAVWTPRPVSEEEARKNLLWLESAYWKNHRIVDGDNWTDEHRNRLIKVLEWAKQKEVT